MASNTAQRLMDAVLLSIREHGYAGTSMQDLLRSTSVSSSSMYHHFPGGKEELVASAVRRDGLHAAEQIEQCLEQYGFAKGVAVIFKAASAEMDSHDFQLGCPIGVPATEAAADSELIQAAVSEVFEAWATAYEKAAIGSGLAKTKAASLGRFIVAAYEGAVTLARSTRSLLPYRDATTVLSRHITAS